MEFTEREVLVISLPDRPGELAKVTKKLARAGINIESLFLLGSRVQAEEVAIGVDKLDKAQELLSKYRT
jgi:hypothetical protein